MMISELWTEIEKINPDKFNELRELFINDYGHIFDCTICPESHKHLAICENGCLIKENCLNNAQISMYQESKINNATIYGGEGYIIIS